MLTTYLFAAVLALPTTTSYSTLTPVQQAAFYRTNGRSAIGRRLHLHIPAKPFFDPPKRVRTHTRRNVVYNAYTYRGVTFLVHPGNPYYQQFLRKAKKKYDACLRGRVTRFREPVGRAFVIHQMRAMRKGGHGTSAAPEDRVLGGMWISYMQQQGPVTDQMVASVSEARGAPETTQGPLRGNGVKLTEVERVGLASSGRWRRLDSSSAGQAPPRRGGRSEELDDHSLAKQLIHSHSGAATRCGRPCGESRRGAGRR